MTAADRTMRDAVLRYHLRLERLSVSASRTILADIEAALRDVSGAIRQRSRGDETFTLARLIALRGELAALRTALADKIAGRVRASGFAAAEAAGGLGRATARDLNIVASWIDVPVGSLRETLAVPFDGLTWTRWGSKLAHDVLDRTDSELRQAIALGEPIRDAAKRFERLLGLAKPSAQKLARTALNDIGNRARMTTYRANRAVIGSVRFVATLDARTSAICRGLDGKTYNLDDPKLPRPPRHPNCRSVLVPVTKTFRELGIDIDEPAAGTRASADGPVSASLSYADWLKTQPEEFQREVLGPTRFNAWKAGLPIDAMATDDRELTIAELKRFYPEKFKAAA